MGHSQATKEKISQTLKAKGIKPLQRFDWTGRHLSEAHIEKVRKGNMHPRPNFQNENSHQWKGEKVGYTALHAWVKKNLGKPSYCAICQITTAKRFEWANISHAYKRDLSDWIRLCTSCHKKYDLGKIKLLDSNKKTT